ncbi:MAG: phosphatase PAP2 family protein [Candidatus Dormibacteria bacterium]
MDFQLEQQVNSAAGANHFLDVVMVALAQWSEPFFIALVLGWLGFGLVRAARSERRWAQAALLASGVALAANQLIALAWHRPRPFVAHPGSVHVLLAHTADASFPSDHVAAAMAIAVVAWYVHRRLGLAAVGLTAAVGYARVFVGDHYPGDVLGGAVVGLLAAAVVISPPVRGVISTFDRYVVERAHPRR